MKFFKIKEQQILYKYLKQNVGWLCPDPHGFQRKCYVGYWLHRFLFEMKFVTEENTFLSRVELHAIVNSIIKNTNKNIWISIIVLMED